MLQGIIDALMTGITRQTKRHSRSFAFFSKASYSFIVC